MKKKKNFFLFDSLRERDLYKKQRKSATVAVPGSPLRKEKEKKDRRECGKKKLKKVEILGGKKKEWIPAADFDFSVCKI